MLSVGHFRAKLGKQVILDLGYYVIVEESKVSLYHFGGNKYYHDIFEERKLSIAHFLSNLGCYAIQEESQLSTLEKTYPNHNKCDEDCN